MPYIATCPNCHKEYLTDNPDELDFMCATCWAHISKENEEWELEEEAAYKCRLVP